MNFQVLNLLYRCSKEFSHQKIRTCGLSDTECMISTYVYANSGCSQDDVSTALRMDKTTIAKAVAKLEEKGYLLRTGSVTDKRRKVLTLTPLGAEQIRDVMDLHDRWLQAILPCLSEKEQQEFESCCVRLLDAAEKLINDNSSQEDKHESR